MAKPLTTEEALENGLAKLMTTPDITLSGKQIIEDINNKKIAIKESLNHDRHLVIKTVAITTGFWFSIVAAFLVGTQF